jgi:hypothetical protein
MRLTNQQARLRRVAHQRVQLFRCAAICLLRNCHVELHKVCIAGSLIRYSGSRAAILFDLSAARRGYPDFLNKIIDAT